MNSYFIYTIAK